MSETDAADKRDTQFVSSLGRGLSILSAFGPNDRSLSNRELAERTGLPRPTVSRFTHTLRKLNYLIYQERLGRFSLAPRVVELSQSAIASTGIRDITRPAMAALSEMGDVSAALGIPKDLTIRYIDLVRRPEAIVLSLEVGALLPMLQTAIGRAYLAGIPEGVRTTTIARLKDADPEGWAQNEDDLRQAIQDLETRGYTRSFGGWRPELNAIATTISIGEEGGLLLLSLSGLSSIMTAEKAETYFAPALLGSARAIESRMRQRYLE